MALATFCHVGVESKNVAPSLRALVHDLSATRRWPYSCRVASLLTNTSVAGPVLGLKVTDVSHFPASVPCTPPLPCSVPETVFILPPSSVCAPFPNDRCKCKSVSSQEMVAFPTHSKAVRPVVRPRSTTSGRVTRYCSVSARRTTRNVLVVSAEIEFPQNDSFAAAEPYATHPASRFDAITAAVSADTCSHTTNVRFLNPAPPSTTGGSIMDRWTSPLSAGSGSFAALIAMAEKNQRACTPTAYTVCYHTHPHTLSHLRARTHAHTCVRPTTLATHTTLENPQTCHVCDNQQTRTSIHPPPFLSTGSGGTHATHAAATRAPPRPPYTQHVQCPAGGR
eukprot:m.1397798 g.1397798  ORF g.1397798 m.1397798 type:complete len:337 (-) comp24999_c0_seq4:1234-2244(-)